MEEHIFLSVILKSLCLVGVWPSNFKNNYLNVLHKYYSKFLTVYFPMFLLTEYVEIFFSHNVDMIDIVANLSVSLLYTVTLIKTVIAKSAKSVEFIRLIQETERHVYEGSDESVKRIFKVYTIRNHKLNKFIVGLVLVTLIPFFVNPMILELTSPIKKYVEIIDNKTVYPERPLPFRSWFPFDKNRHHYLAFSIQIFSGLVGGGLTGFTDNLFWGFIIFGLGQIKILQHKLTNSKSYGQMYAREMNVSREEGIVHVLKDCIFLHQSIIRFFAELDASLNVLMLIDFGICSMQIGVIGFQIVVVGLGWSQVFAMQYLSSMLIQMFLFHWHANEIRLESLNIPTAIWESDFYEYPTYIQKMLRFIMMRCVKPMVLKIGPFYPMSTATALSVLRAGYSYVALMREAYK